MRNKLLSLIITILGLGFLLFLAVNPTYLVWFVVSAVSIFIFVFVWNLMDDWLNDRN